MTIDEMKARKAELGYTNEKIAELSGVPLGTVQKIFAGETKSPRYDTVCKLVSLLEKPSADKEKYTYTADNAGSVVMESSAIYNYGLQEMPAKQKVTHAGELYLKPSKKLIGIADGKYKMPPDEMFYDDEISEMFEDI